MEKITVTIKDGEYGSMGNWDGAKELFPTIEINQQTANVTITYWSVSNSKRGQWGLTHEHKEEISTDGQILRITGMTGLRNDRRNVGGLQKFCYIVFRGDSGHIYVHRAIANKGWIESPIETMLKRIVKLGIGATSGVIQQGDFLLKPANGNAYNDSEFVHETMGSGHHKFIVPVLFADGKHGRQYKINEPVTLIHHAIDGIQHPDIVVTAGKWIAGNTANSLQHSNKRD